MNVPPLISHKDYEPAYCISTLLFNSRKKGEVVRQLKLPSVLQDNLTFKYISYFFQEGGLVN